MDVVHGHQQLALFNGHYGERCFLPIHVYDTATSRPVAMLLRPGATPSGEEIRGHLRRMVRRIRSHWPNTRLTIRGDGHYGRPEVMAWCEANGLDYIFGLPGNAVLDRLVEPVADDVRVRRAQAQAPVVRRYCETDVMNTYLLFLRFELLRGMMTADEYTSEVSLAYPPPLSSSI